MSDSDSDLDLGSTLDLPTDDDSDEAPSPKAKPKPKPKPKKATGGDSDSDSGDELLDTEEEEEEGEEEGEEDEETEEEEESGEEATDSDASSEAASLESTASDSPPKKKPEPEKAEKAEKEKPTAAPASPPAEPKETKPKPKPDPPKKAEPKPKAEEKPKPPPEKKREDRSPPATARQPAAKKSPRPQSTTPRPQTARRSTPSPKPSSPSPTFGGGSTRSVRPLPKDSHLNAPTSAYKARLEEAKNTRKSLKSQTTTLKKARPQEQSCPLPPKVPSFKFVLGKRVSEMKAAPSAAFTTATPRFAWATSGEKTPAPGEFFHPKNPQKQTSFPPAEGREKRVAGFGSTLERDTVYSISNGQLFSTRRRSKKKPEEPVPTTQCPYSSFACIKRGKAMKEEKGSAWAKSRVPRGETASPLPESTTGLDRVQKTRLKAKQAELARERELRSKVGARDPTETSQQEWVKKARESVVRKASDPPPKKGQKRVGFGASSSRDCLHYGKISQSPAPGSYLEM